MLTNACRSFAAILLLTAACDSGDEPLELEQLPGEVSAMVCAAQVDCGAFPDIATCLASTSNSLDVDGLRMDIDAGVIDYDGEAAQRCIDLFAVLVTCELVATSDRFREIEATCAETFGGTVADGGACTEDEQCAGFLADCEADACPDQCCAGVCATAPRIEAAIGESCADAFCVIGSFCDETDTCTARPVPGEPCSQFDSCVDGSLCDVQGSGTCFALASPGEPCDPQGVFGFSCLRTDNYCEPDTGVCTPRLAVGESCSVELQECVGFAFCDAGTCAERPGPGDACVLDGEPDCLGELDCVSGACVLDTAVFPHCPLGG